MVDKTLTSANSSFVLAVPALALGPFSVQGYSADDAFTLDPVDVAETVMGVDGIMSAGFLPFITPMVVTLQADSDSLAAFEAWLGAQQVRRDLSYGTGIIAIPSIQKQYTLTKGALKRVSQMPSARKILQPVTYGIDWGSVVIAPLPV
jgi:tetrahydromethanopterin S-methyltransferase subunit C